MQSKLKQTIRKKKLYEKERERIALENRKFKKRSFSLVHQTIIKSANVEEAASKLGVFGIPLEKYLNQILFDGQPLTFHSLKNLSIMQVKSEFKDAYNHHMAAQAANLAEYDIRYIHQCIQNHSLTAASFKFLMVGPTFKVQLSKFTFKDKPFIFEDFKQLSAQSLDAMVKSQDFEIIAMPHKTRQVNYSMDYIHRIIIKSSSISNACTLLKLHFRTLITYLGKFNLTYLRLKNELTEKSMALEYGEYYKKVWVPKIKGADSYPFSVLHNHIYKNGNTRITNRILVENIGLNHSTLEQYLAKIKYNGESLSIDRLKSITPKDLEQAWGSSTYNKPIKKEKLVLDSLPFNYIHKVISKSSKILTAGNTLGVDKGVLERYLGKFGFDFTSLKAMKEKDMLARYPDRYNQPWQSTPTDLKKFSIRDIHKVISQTKEGVVAHRFGVTTSILDQHLKHYLYNGQTLSIDFLKNCTFPLAMYPAISQPETLKSNSLISENNSLQDDDVVVNNDVDADDDIDVDNGDVDADDDIDVDNDEVASNMESENNNLKKNKENSNSNPNPSMYSFYQPKKVDESDLLLDLGTPCFYD
ncbi:MAG: hypothetical protein WC627_10390 [Legionella sp.]|jgi:hypothetical protein